MADDDDEEKKKKNDDAPALQLVSDEAKTAEDAPQGWVDEDERQAAAQKGQQVCPQCGDWLPLELWEYRCAGKGHHYAVSRTSIYPAGPAEQILARERERDERMRRWPKVLGDVLLVVFIVLFVVLIFAVLLRTQ